MIPNATPRPRNLWPHAILAWFLAFAGALAGWIAFAVRQPMDLVRPDYYEEEIRFQKQLDRLNRTAAVRGEVAINYEAARDEVTVRLPAAHLPQRTDGRVQFYRPADAALDFEVPLAVDASGVQRIDTGGLRAGYWKVRVRWRVVEAEFDFERAVVLAEGDGGLAAAAEGR